MENITITEYDGIDFSDYPEFCDAFVSKAQYQNGQPLTDQEMDEIEVSNEDLWDFITSNIF